MVFTFVCSACTSRKFFSPRMIYDHNTYCAACLLDLKEKEKEKSQKLQEEKRAQRKRIRKVENEKRLNEELRLELETKRSKKETIIQKENHKHYNNNNYNKDKEISISKNTTKKRERTLLNEATQAAAVFNSVIYVSVDVKRIKVIEWRNGKKRILLNKEREIRHTHKGGWSQEKFQSFVKSQKAKAPQWIEDNLNREGVLRGPYQHQFIDCNDEDLRDVIKKSLNR